MQNIGQDGKNISKNPNSSIADVSKKIIGVQH
jgi:hypothetical protein